MKATGIRVAGFLIGADAEFMVMSYDVSAPEFGAALTEAERAVAHAAGDGKSNAAIAAGRGVSQRTVANQMAAILKKLGLRSRLDLALRS